MSKMTIKEFIQKLNQLPPEATIVELQDDEVVVQTEDKNNILTVCVS